MGTYRILSLDGGGIRGLVTAILLERLDVAVPGWRDKIDLIAGTSTGGVLALGLAHGLSPGELRELYEKKGKKIFDDSWLDDLKDMGSLMGAKYDNRNLRKELRRVLGDVKLGALGKRVVIPTFNLNNGKTDSSEQCWTPKVFHNFPGEDTDGDEPAVEVALRTTAAPTYFPTLETYIDGGVYANNPSLCALAQTQDDRTTDPRPAVADVVLLSIGTGQSLTFVKGRNHDWGYAQWAKPLLNILMDGVSGIAHYQCKQLLGARYHRLAPEFPHDVSIPLDDVKRIPDLIAFASRADTGPAAQWLRAVW